MSKEKKKPVVTNNTSNHQTSVQTKKTIEISLAAANQIKVTDELFHMLMNKVPDIDCAIFIQSNKIMVNAFEPQGLMKSGHRKQLLAIAEEMFYEQTAAILREIGATTKSLQPFKHIVDNETMLRTFFAEASNMTDSNRHNALSFMIKEGVINETELTLVDLLSDKYAKPHLKHANDSKLLFHAIQLQSLNIVQVLVNDFPDFLQEKGVLEFAVTTFVRLIDIQQDATEKAVEIIKVLVNARPERLKEKGCQKLKPIEFAIAESTKLSATNHATKIVQVLVDAYKKYLKVTDYDQVALLRFAITHGARQDGGDYAVEIVKVIVNAYKDNLKTQGADNATLLEFAIKQCGVMGIEKKSGEIIQVIINASPDLLQEQGVATLNPLAFAIKAGTQADRENNFLEIIKVLVDAYKTYLKATDYDQVALLKFAIAESTTLSATNHAIEIVQVLVDVYKTYLKATDYDQVALLRFAIARGAKKGAGDYAVEIVKVLVNAYKDNLKTISADNPDNPKTEGADKPDNLKTKGAYKLTLLEFAIQQCGVMGIKKKSGEIIQVIINASPDLLQEQGVATLKPLAFAIDAGTQAGKESHFLEIIKVLVDASSDLEKPCYNNKTPLEYAIALGVKIEGKIQAPLIVLSIAKGYKSDAINKVAPSGFKPIEWAIAMYSSSTKREQSLNIVKVMAACCKDYLDEIGYQNFTPLTMAVTQGLLDIVKCFLDRGADMHKLDGNNKSPLATAKGLFEKTSNNQYKAIIEHMLEIGASDVVNDTQESYAQGEQLLISSAIEETKLVQQTQDDITAEFIRGDVTISGGHL